MKKLIVALAFAAALIAAPQASGTSGAFADRDHDGVDGRNELRQGTDPRTRDSDGDGRADGREDADRDGLSNADEDATGNDPIDRDSDDDGVRDGAEGAGVVTSIEDGTLTMRLAGGGTVRAAVDAFTDLRCPTEAGYERTQPRSLRKRRAAGRRGGKGHGAQSPEGRRGGKGHGAQAAEDMRGGQAHGAQAPEEEPGEETDDEWTDEDDGEPGGDDDLGDGDWSEGTDGEDGASDDGEDADDEDWGDDSAPSPCLDHVARGTRVHASTTDADENGIWFAELAIVR